MICFIKNRNKLCKNILWDIWGHTKLYLKPTKLIQLQVSMQNNDERRRKYYRKQFSFSLEKRIKFKWKKRFKKKYLKHRLLYNYFLFIRRNMFLRYAYKAKRQTGSFIRNYLALIEGRLFMLIYRSNFVSNIFKLKFVIDKGIFFVNMVRRYYLNYNVKVGDLIQIDFNYRKLLRDDLRIRLKYFKTLQSKTYRYMFINYKFMFIFFLRTPRFKEIKYPLKLDLYLGSSLYFL